MADRLVVEGILKISNSPIDILNKTIGKVVKSTEKLEKKFNRLGRVAKVTGYKMKKSLNAFNEKYQKKDSDSMVKRLGTLALAYGALSKVTESISLASDMQETQQLVNVVYGNMTKDANKWADNYATTMGFSKLKTKEALGDMGNLFTGFGMGSKEALGFSQNIVSMANDLDSFGNLSAKGIDVQKNMISALMGSSESAAAFGVSLLEPQLQVAALDMGYGKYSNTMDQVTKMKIRYHAIEMQSKNAIGDVARNLESETGMRRRLTASIKDAQVQIGTKLLPIQMKLLDIGLKTVSFLNENSSTIESLIPVVVALVGAITTYKTIMLATNLAQKALNISMAANPIGLVVGALAALAYGAYEVYKNWDYLKAKTLELWETFKGSAFYNIFKYSPLGLAISYVEKLYGWYQKFKGTAGKKTIDVNNTTTQNSSMGALGVPAYATQNSNYVNSASSNTSSNSSTTTININNPSGNGKEIMEQLRPHMEEEDRRKREQKYQMYGGRA